ncbi:MAG TPA: hypothetical protein VF180_13350 [Acidimicrobiia bacterium]
MGTVVGLDLSLTSSGRCVLDAGWFACSVVGSKGSRSATLAARGVRLTRLRNGILAVLDSAAPDLVVVEGPAYSTKGGSPLDRYGLWWAVVSVALDLVPVGVVPPAVVKAYATGRGNADKVEVALAAERRWGTCAHGLDGPDQADALVLAAMGAHRLGRPVTKPTAWQEAALEKAEWPEGIT